jgi:hypothetical protein
MSNESQILLTGVICEVSEHSGALVFTVKQK